MLDTVLGGIIILGFITILTYLIWPAVKFNWLQNSSFLLVLSLPFERLPSLEAGGVNIRISQILVLVGFYFLFILLVKKDAQLLGTKLHGIFYWMAGFWVALLPSLFIAVNGQRQLQVLIATALAFGATFLISNFLPKIIKTVKYLVIIMTGVGVFGLYQFVGDFVGVPYTLTLLREHYTKKVFGFARIQATALEPLYWGGMLLLPCVFLILYLTLKHKNHIPNLKNGLIELFQSKIFLLSAFSILALNLVLTLSRGAYLAFLATVLVALALGLKDFDWSKVVKTILPYLLAAIVLGGLGLVTTNSTALIEKAADHVLNVFSDKQFSTFERLNFLTEAFDLIYQNAILGIGSGNYGPRVQNNQPQGDGGWLIVNNVYVEVWLEQGLTALLVFIGMLIYVLCLSFKNLNQKSKFETDPDQEMHLTKISLIAATIGYLLQWLTFSPIFIMPFFIILGILARSVAE